MWPDAIITPFIGYKNPGTYAALQDGRFFAAQVLCSVEVCVRRDGACCSAFVQCGDALRRRI
ncbi:hypothetical protein PSEUDO8Z_90185 [Pseudomonas sp. 8Z]|nr:hypothetical protein PSEUDO8Z_90185 [Pseudomonas sp. 8Z]